MLERANQHSIAYRLGRDPSQVAYAREQARKALPCWGLDEHSHLIELLLSELVTNALRHGDGEIDVCVAHACGQLRIEVHDKGHKRPVLRRPTPDDMSGRGLALVDGLMKAHGGVWGVVEDPAGPGKAVFAAMWIPPSTDSGADVLVTDQ